MRMSTSQTSRLSINHMTLYLLTSYIPYDIVQADIVKFTRKAASMKKSAMGFVALVSGEKPGDPELGGWRALPATVYSATVDRDLLAPAQPESNSGQQSLKAAVELVALRVRTFTLRKALGTIVSRLRDWEGVMTA